MSEKVFFGFYWMLWILTWLVSSQAGVYVLIYMKDSQYGMAMGWMAALTVIVLCWAIWFAIIAIMDRYVRQND